MGTPASKWTINYFDGTGVERSASAPDPIPPPSTLCHGCSAIFVDNPEVNILPYMEFGQPRPKPFQLSFAGLRESANSDKCHLCFLIVQSFSNKAHRLHETRKGLPDDGSVRFYLWGYKSDRRMAGIHLELAEQPAFTASILIHDIIATKPLLFNYWQREKSTNGGTSFHIAKRWLNNCTQNHQQCKQQPPGTPFVPTRLIDLGPDDMVIEPSLVLTTALEAITSYATLSHCWGTGQFIRLTKASLEDMKREIPISGLSKTFRDAIETAKRLGFRFLWIDSLCIIQDDINDWRAEAAMMADVYYNSGLNIAATKSASGETGCFSSRSPRHVEPCVIEASSGGVGDVSTQTYFLSNPSFWDTQTSYSPLYSRAWVTQEFILVPRILHFASDQILWECKSLQASETYPGGVPRRTAHKLSTDPGCLSALLRGPEDAAYHRYLLWDKILDEYSAASLTFPAKDKLIAVSGMARKIGISDHHNDRLVAGLWRRQLPRQLLWTTGGSRPTINERPAAYQAPSWSWASLNGAVSTQVSENNMRRMARNAKFHSSGVVDPLLEKVYVAVQDIEVFHVDDDVRAPLRGGFLRISGPIIVVSPKRVVESSSKKRCSLGVRPELHCNVHGDNWAVEMTPATVTVRCLFVLLKDEENPSAYGIFLRATGAAKGEYQRIGLCEIVGSQFDGNTVANLEAVLRGGLPVDDEEVEGVDRTHGDGIPRYLITIV